MRRDRERKADKNLHAVTKPQLLPKLRAAHSRFAIIADYNRLQPITAITADYSHYSRLQPITAAYRF